MELTRKSLSVLVGLISCLFFIHGYSANTDLKHPTRNSLQETHTLAAGNRTDNHTRSQLKDLLNLLSKDRNGGGMSALRQLNSTFHMNPALANNSLAYLLRLGNGTLNAGMIADVLNRTSRGYGGGGYGGGWGEYYGGGFDPTLWLLLNNDHGWGWGQQQSSGQNDKSMENLGELGLLTLLGLALIARMPTQG